MKNELYINHDLSMKQLLNNLVPLYDEVVLEPNRIVLKRSKTKSFLDALNDSVHIEFHK